jgi:hypothetical protein
MVIEACSKIAGFRTVELLYPGKQSASSSPFSREGRRVLIKIMKTTHLLVALIAATLPITAGRAEDTAKIETTDQKQEQSSDTTEMKDMMDNGQMMSNLKNQDAELDKLVAEMNSAPADKKIDSVAAALTKLVELRKAMHEQMQKMMAGKEKEGMSKCRMMMDMGGDHDGEHSHHH